jgi:hypothetical protein
MRVGAPAVIVITYDEQFAPHRSRKGHLNSTLSLTGFSGRKARRS